MPTFSEKNDTKQGPAGDSKVSGTGAGLQEEVGIQEAYRYEDNSEPTFCNQKK